MQKNNRTLNQEHERRQEGRVRPKQPEYNFKPLEEVIGEELDDFWCISEEMANWEEENAEE